MPKDPFAKFMFQVKEQVNSRLRGAGIPIPEGYSNKGGGYYPNPSSGLKIDYHMRYFAFWYKSRRFWKEYDCHIESSLCLPDSMRAGNMFVSLSCDPTLVPTWNSVRQYFHGLPNNNEFSMSIFPPGTKDECIYKFIPVPNLSNSQSSTSTEISLIVDALFWLITGPGQHIHI